MNLRGKNISYCLLFLFLITAVQKVYAGIDNPIVTVLDGSKNQIAKDSMVTSADSLFFSGSFASNLKKPYPVKDVITFHINEQSLIVLPDSFKAVVHVRIFFTDSTNTLDSMNDVRLAINYYKSTSYAARASFIFSGAYAVRIKVLSDTIPGAVMSALMVDNEIIPSRIYTFSCSDKAIKTINYVGATADELTVSWSNIIGIDEADVEWAFIDSSALAAGLYSTGGSYDPNLIFNHNTTRVSVAALSYNIPLIFSGPGSVFVRARTVQTDGGKHIASAWSSDYLPAGMLKYDFSGHEDSLNWQSSISYAEEGKRKVVVQYFDGSLRSRQTTTKDNTSNTTITAETFYDYQGRPTIQVLPAPSINTIIQYTANFNRVNGAEYDKSNFDTITDTSQTTCSLIAPAMDSNYGAAWYYSANNTFVNNGVNRYIPDAYGYAFTQTEYTQDNTGRISRQSGVGQDFRLNSGHETKYYYSITPDQNELDALFGTEAGDHTHYFKNAVRDANGQYSVSYVDMHGRTVATALSGDSTTGMAPLSSNTISAMTRTLADANTNVTDGLSMTSHADLLVDVSGPQHFVYSLSPQSFQLNDCNNTSICYDCLYDLTITITDDCDNHAFGGHPLVISRPNISVADAICNGSSIVVDDTINLSEGEYQITKTLTVNKKAEEDYFSNIYSPHNNCKTLSNFILVQQQSLPHGNCTVTCASCLASIGSYTDFANNYMLKVYGDSTTLSAHQPEIETAYQNALASCNTYCDDTVYEKTDYIREAMLFDVSPKSGQYADLDSSGDIYSIFYKTGSATPFYQQVSVYTDENGLPDSVWDNVQSKKVRPQELDPKQFAEDFKPSWADSLLKFHPEYCKLQAYENHYSAYTWQKKFDAITSYSDAIAKGFANPLSGLNADPLSTDASFSSDLSNKYISYVTVTSGSSTRTLSMWEMAILNIKCPNGDSACLANIIFNGGDSSISCTGDSNQVWQNFQSFYDNSRTELLNNYYATGVSCTVTSTDLLNDHHTLNFNTATNELDQNGLGFASSSDKQAITDSANALMKRYYQSNCEAYQPLWAQQLSAGYSSTQIDSLLPLLTDVCIIGSDQDHPFGSRSIGSDSPSIHETINGNVYWIRSFDDVISDYNDANGIAFSDTTTADLITTPPAYYSQPIYTKSVITQPSSSECESILFYQEDYDANKFSGESFSQYLKRVYNTNMSDEDLDALTNSCSVSSPSCNYFTHPISLPPIFQTSPGSGCTDCNMYGTLVSEYVNLYGDSLMPVAADQTDTVQQKKNQLFTNFMNNQLGYNLSISDYLNFQDQCNSYSSSDSNETSLECNNWLKLEGSAPEVLIGDLDVDSTQLTVEALVNDYNNVNGGDIVSKHSYPGDVNYLLRPFGAEITTTSGYHRASQTCDFDTAKTYHVAMVYDGQYLKFYRNGFLEGQDTCTGNMILNNWWTTIGSTAANSTEHYYPSDIHGYINEVRIWNVARTQNQIRQYMGSSLPNPPTQTGLLAYYIFDSLKNRQGNASWNGILLNDVTINQTNPKCSFIADSCPQIIQPPMLCGRSQYAFPVIATDTINSCTDSTFFAVSTGTEQYNHYLDSLKKAFDSAYYSKCLSAYKYETFTVSDSVKEYHYTLYYYDQAGNLIQTIPPKAVHPNWNSTYLAQVKVKRASGDTLRPGHDLTLATEYRYNTLNQVISQQTPDAGTSTFFYDRLGRLVLSQNAKQSPSSKYSYTTYDPLGRITEVGELANASAMSTTISKSPGQLSTWLTTADASRTQITHTTYDTVYYGIDSVVLNAHHLRNRVSYTQYFKTASDQAVPKPQAGTFYSYDIEGNVDTLVQDYVISSLDSSYNRFFKKIVYQYDLISGKVNVVAYDPGQPDAFYHRYTYDAENRLTNAETSIDSVYWENEAFYKYYSHGPLARSILGELQVQGVDYAYTLQGWLKGINTTDAGAVLDMGNDGFSSPVSANQYVGRDAYGFALYYFGKDYKAINKNVLPFAKMDTTILTDFKPLYNGNIAAIGENQTSFAKPLLFSFKYDQLNRLVQMRTYRNTATTFASTNTWTPAAINDYNEDVAYDPNGNILKYKRYGNSTNNQLTNAKLMDSLTYNYETNSNRLDWIKDTVNASRFSVDIDSQSTDNYAYDAIGNLIRDNKEGIDSILWTVYGKIQKIYKHNGTVISYSYDASGNRLSKIVTGASSGNGETWYVHDASGNIMSIYTVHDNTVNSGALTLSEQNIYGSSRLGIYKPGLNLITYDTTSIYMNRLGKVAHNFNFVRGQKFFELNNHLGNVLVTVTDKKPGVDSNNNGLIDYYTADIVSASDYYPFGMQMPGRDTTFKSPYRYGFNGKEIDRNITSEDYDYDARIYDARVGRFLSIDPLEKEFVWQSVYCYAGDNPIKFMDIDGEGPGDPLDKTLEDRLRTKLNANSFVDIIKRCNNFSLRALERWGWKGNPTDQQENKVSGLSGEAIVTADLNTISMFTVVKEGERRFFSPELSPVSQELITINATGDGDDDKTVDILMNVQAGNLAEGAKFGITMPFVNSQGGVDNAKNGGTSYDQTTTNFTIEVKTGVSIQNFKKGMWQAIRQTEKLNQRAPNCLNVPVLALDRDAYLEALKNPSFLEALKEFSAAGGKILNIDHLNDKAKQLKEDVREEVRNGEYIQEGQPNN